MCSEYHSDADLSLPGTALYRAGLRPETHSLTVRARRLIGQDMDLVALL